jgi:hypothetical protein
MNPIVISTIIAAASFILTIFCAIYLNQRHVDKLVDQLDKRFEARITGVEQTMNSRITGLDQTMNARFDSLNTRIDARFDSVNIRFDGVERRLSSVEGCLDRIEQVLFKPIVPGV